VDVPKILLKGCFPFGGPVQLEQQAPGDKRVGYHPLVDGRMGQRTDSSGEGDELRFVDGLGNQKRLRGGDNRYGQDAKEKKD
jgi:hypothetical protein